MFTIDFTEKKRIVISNPKRTKVLMGLPFHSQSIWIYLSKNNLIIGQGDVIENIYGVLMTFSDNNLRFVQNFFFDVNYTVNVEVANMKVLNRQIQVLNDFSEMINSWEFVKWANSSTLYSVETMAGADPCITNDDNTESNEIKQFIQKLFSASSKEQNLKAMKNYKSDKFYNMKIQWLCDLNTSFDFELQFASEDKCDRFLILKTAWACEQFINNISETLKFNDKKSEDIYCFKTSGNKHEKGVVKDKMHQLGFY